MSKRAQALRNIIEFERKIAELEHSIHHMVARWEKLNRTEELDDEDRALFNEYMDVKRQRYVQCLERISSDLALRLI